MVFAAVDLNNLPEAAVGLVVETATAAAAPDDCGSEDAVDDDGSLSSTPPDGAPSPGDEMTFGLEQIVVSLALLTVSLLILSTPSSRRAAKAVIGRLFCAWPERWRQRWPPPWRSQGGGGGSDREQGGLRARLAARVREEVALSARAPSGDGCDDYSATPRRSTAATSKAAAWKRHALQTSKTWTEGDFAAAGATSSSSSNEATATEATSSLLTGSFFVPPQSSSVDVPTMTQSQEYEEETDHDRFKRLWRSDIRYSAYKSLVLPPECKQVEPPANGQDRGPDEKGSPRDRIMRIARASGHVIYRLVTLQYTLDFLLWVMGAISYRLKKARGLPVGDEEEEEDEEDEDASLASRASLATIARSARGAASTPAPPQQPLFQPHSPNRLKEALNPPPPPPPESPCDSLGTLTTFPSSDNLCMLHDEVAGDPSSHDSVESFPAVALQQLTKKMEFDLDEMRRRHGDNDWEEKKETGAASIEHGQSLLRDDEGDSVATVCDKREWDEPTADDTGIEPSLSLSFVSAQVGGTETAKTIPFRSSSGLGIVGNRDRFDSYGTAKGTEREQSGSLCSEGGVSVGAPPKLISRMEPKSVRHKCDARLLLEQKNRQRSISPMPRVPMRKKRDALETYRKNSLAPPSIPTSQNPPYINSLPPSFGEKDFRRSLDGTPMNFFDAANSDGQLKTLSRLVPVPDKHGYILGDEFLPNSRCNPLLVFVNSRSGPQQGQLLIAQLRRLLNPIQIWDLASGGPEKVLESFSVLSRLRILVCGGDGTVSWIISSLEKMALERWPPIAILPLGTGNDLARIHGWGGGYNNESFLLILQQLSEAYVSLLDRWELSVLNKKGKIKNTKSFTNYLGVGVDAQAALQVHMLRESKPKLFFSRVVNKAWYAVAGAEDAIKASCSNLPQQITLIADGVEIPLPPDSQGIIFLNIDSYSGGVQLWSHGTPFRSFRGANRRRYSEGDMSSRRKFERLDSAAEEMDCDNHPKGLSYDEKLSQVTACDRPSSCQDGMLDVVSIRGTFHLGQIRVGLSNAQLICQCREATVTLKKKIAVQIDGEPWRQNTSTLKITRKKEPAIMLHRAADEGGGVEVEMAKLLDWAEERSVIDRHVHTILMKEFSRRIENKNRQRRVRSQDNLMLTMKRAFVGANDSL